MTDTPDLQTALQLPGSCASAWPDLEFFDGDEEGDDKDWVVGVPQRDLDGPPYLLGPDEVREGRRPRVWKPIATVRGRAAAEALAAHLNGLAAPTPLAPDAGLFRLPPWLCADLLRWCRRMVQGLPAAAPHGFTIGGEDSPYLRRWFLAPRGGGPSCYLHQFLRDDDDRALHDHPWDSVSVILSGGYVEHLPGGRAEERRVGDVLHRAALHRHRVALHRDPATAKPIEAWTLFLVGQRVRDWGFWCGEGTPAERFVPWPDFTASPNGELVGKGCGE